MAMSWKNVSIPALEVRHVDSGASKSGKPYRSIKVEDEQGYSGELSCSDPLLFDTIDGLVKGDVINVIASVICTKMYNFTALNGLDAIELVGNAYRSAK